MNSYNQLKDTACRVIVVGTYATKFPEKFQDADLIILGEPERFFKEWDGDLNSMFAGKKIKSSEPYNSLNELPDPSFRRMTYTQFAYKPILRKPTAFIESSRGCPYSCGYYCTYGENQGKSIRSYTPERLVKQMKSLTEKYGFKSFNLEIPFLAYQGSGSMNFVTC